MLTFVVALHCEAKPIIDGYKLKKVADKPFDLYRVDQDGDQIELVITGIGALSVASAVGWVAGRDCSMSEQRVWLNVGTAGHANRDLGNIVLAHGVGDEVQQRSHYPPLVAKWQGKTDAILSVSAPTSNYPLGAAVDMEAYAFFNVAIRFSDSELVQSLKVISDNEQSSIEHLNAKKLTELVQQNINQIQLFAQSLNSIKPQKLNVNYALLSHLTGTHSQRLQAHELLARVSALVSDSDFKIKDLKESLEMLSQLKEALPVLRDCVDSITPSMVRQHG